MLRHRLGLPPTVIDTSTVLGIITLHIRSPFTIMPMSASRMAPVIAMRWGLSSAALSAVWRVPRWEGETARLLRPLREHCLAY